jgi:hypothetical protein
MKLRSLASEDAVVLVSHLASNGHLCQKQQTVALHILLSMPMKVNLGPAKTGKSCGMIHTSS